MNISRNPSAPYPSAEGIMKNPRLINGAMAARCDELNTISDYVYYGIILAECHPALSELFEKLAMTEMLHFRLLGQMILALGGNPCVRTRVNSASVCVPPTTCDVKRLLESAISGERKACVEYKRLAAEACGDKVAEEIFCRLASDEESHAKMLCAALNGI